MKGGLAVCDGLAAVCDGLAAVFDRCRESCRPGVGPIAPGRAAPPFRAAYSAGLAVVVSLPWPGLASGLAQAAFLIKGASLAVAPCRRGFT